MNAPFLHEHSLGASASLSIGLAAVGTVLGSVLPYLQPIAYILSIAVSVSALYRAWKKRP